MTWWTAFEIAINLFQGFLMIFFMRNQIHVSRKNHLIDTAFILAIGAFQSLYLFYSISVPDTITFVIPFAYARIISDEKWYINLFWSVVLSLLFIATTGLVENLYMISPSVSAETIMTESQLRVAFVVTCNIALLLVIFLVIRFTHSQGTLSWLSIALFVVLIAIQLLTAELLFSIRLYATQETELFVYADFCLLLAALISLALFEFLSVTTEKRHQAESELRTLQASQHHSDELRGMYVAMIEQQHDLKHRIQSVEQLISCSGQLPTQSIVDELKDYNKIGPEFITGCIAVDAMLTAKKAVIDKNQIRFDFSPYPLHELPISETDFCLILDNLMDNAIEATEQCSVENRRIALSFARSWDMFYVTCENTMRKSSIHMIGSKFASSKGGYVHGYGIQSIRKIAERSRGRCRFIPSDKMFRAEIVLPYCKEEP